MVHRNLIMLVVFMLSVHAVTVKDSVTLNPLNNSFYELYSFPELDILAVGVTNGNGTIPEDMFNTTSNITWAIITKPKYSGFAGRVDSGDTVYLVELEDVAITIDSTCGIECGSPKEVTDDCECLCPVACPVGTVLSKEICSCDYPIVFSPIYENITHLYSQFISYIRIAALSNGTLSLVDEPEGCLVEVFENDGRIMKSLPCKGLDDGLVFCSFAIDDSFLINAEHDIQIKCGDYERNMKIEIQPPQRSNIYNVLLLLADSGELLMTGLFVLLIIGVVMTKW